MIRAPYFERRRVAGLLTGALLLLYGALGRWAGGREFTGPSVQRACEAWLCPGEFSVLRVFNLQQQTGAEAQVLLAQFTRALRQDPASAYRWADLGEEEARAASLDKADYCFDQALEAAPRNPAILFRAGNYDFQNGREDAALKNLRAILVDPELSQYYETVYLTYSRLNLPLDQVLDRGMPRLLTPADGFLKFWVGRNGLEQARQIWQWMSGHSLANDVAAGEFVELLLSNKEDDLAAQTWQEFVAAKEEPGYRQTNWLFNSGFEKPFRPSPLDWKLEQNPDVQAERTQEQGQEGHWSAKLTFLGKDNIIYRGSYQFAVAHPGKWRLSAEIKTEGITTDQGAAIHVFDVWKPSQLDLWSTSITGTQNWTPVEVAFDVQPGTRLLRVDLGRKDSMHIDSKVAGSAWFDSVVLRPAN